MRNGELRNGWAGVGSWRYAEGRGLVWAHREGPGWNGPAGERASRPSEAACFSHSPPDVPLRAYNDRRRAEPVVGT